jgi:N-methylhydantoinase B/oxoprolinase/acetone carboxylase alpha subunit
VTTTTTTTETLGEGKEFLADLLATRPVMYEPDPEIMADHHLAPRTEREAAALASVTDPLELSITHSRIEAIMDSAKDMLQQIAAAPAAKFGDLIVGVYTLHGDLAICTSSGVDVFATTAAPVPKFILKHWKDEPSVGIREGDVFYHNDGAYGGVHNPDHTLLLPLFWDGEQIGWVGAVIHEGENGAAQDPGGFAPRANDPYAEGIRIPPMRIGENYALRRDIVNLFQNQVRDPLLWLIDIRSKLAAARRVETRLHDVMRERGADLVIATMRHLLESTEAEVRRRIAQWPDGVFRAVTFADHTGQEAGLVKIPLEIEKRGHVLTLRAPGAPPALQRAINSMAHMTKATLGTALMNRVFPDLPRNGGFVSAVEFDLDPGTVLTATRYHASTLSVVPDFYIYVGMSVVLPKILFSSGGDVMAPSAAFPTSAVYAGLTQHLLRVANIHPDGNAMGSGAHPDRDGEHAAGAFFAPMSDWGELESIETEVPLLTLWRRLALDNHGFGRHRGGAGPEWAHMTYGSDFFMLLITSPGGRFPINSGLFGGYAAPCVPLTVVRPDGGIDAVRECLHTDPAALTHDAAEMVARRPIPGSYEVQAPMKYAQPVPQGEIWIGRVGGGGGYGDPLEREPESVAADLRQGLISEQVVRDVYHVVIERDTVDHAATETARKGAREARLARARPYDEFLASWRRDAPPEGVEFMGSWEWS